ncbi:MAG: hypothetical protein PHS44_04250 [Candidatus Dojkabacteria bacterium]|nr:hypothetical protein [Candidatus Dojkabacteria bacterium]
MEQSRFSQQFERSLHSIGINRANKSSELIPRLNQLANFACQIRRISFPETASILGGTEVFSTPKLEAWRYAKDPAKGIAIGTIKLIATGVTTIHKAKHLFKCDLNFCRACVSYLIEVQTGWSSVFIKFPQVMEAISLRKIICKESCTKFGIICDEALQATQD